MANLYASFQAWTAIAAWAASTAYTTGQIVRQAATPAVNNERCFRCTTAGTSGSGEPGWNLNKGGTTTDGTVTWTEVTGLEAYQAPGAWAAPFARVQPLTDRMQAGDTGYVASDHSESQTSTINIQCSNGTNITPLVIVSVKRDSTGHVPPIAGDYAPGATVHTTNNHNIVQNGTSAAVFMGITFSCNGPSDGNNFSLSGGVGSDARYIDCTFKLNGNGPNIQSGNSGSVNCLRCTFLFNSTAQRINAAGHWKLKDCKFATSGAAPQYLFSSFYAVTTLIEVEDCDFSNLGSGTALVNGSYGAGKILFKNCRLNAAVQQNVNNSFPIEVFFVRCSSAAQAFIEQKFGHTGAHTGNTQIARAGGRSDGTTPSSWFAGTFNSASLLRPFGTMQMLAWNATVGSQITVTVEGIWDAAVLPTNEDLWSEVEFLGSSTSPMGSLANNGKADRLSAPSNLPASTAAWDAAAPARVNSQSYSTGQVIKLASNPGRLFFCTGGGTAAGSEPAGYANAVDGGSVSDGGATFRAGVRFKLSVPVTAQMAGPIAASIRIARPNTGFYIDPVMTVA